jgi:hypothetical protein
MNAMKGRHPSEADLALLAGGDCGWFRRFRVNRHVARCGDCRDTLASFSELRSDTMQRGSDHTLPDLNWDQMAGEMRANIRLGLAAGECVGELPADGRRRSWMPQLAFGTTGVLLLVGAGVFLHGLLPQENAPAVVRAAELVSTDKGVEVRTNTGSSMALLNPGDVEADQTVTSQGAVQSTYVNGGVVTVARMYGE